MKRYLLVLIVILVNIPLYSQDSTSQSGEFSDTTKTLLVELKDGSEIVGKTIGETDSTVAIKTLSGIEMFIPKSQILKRGTADGFVRKGEFWFADPNQSRTFLAPTARNLKAGRGYISDVLVFFPSLAFGITDYFTMLGGISIFPGGGKQILYFMPKINPVTIFAGDWRTDISAGALIINTPNAREMNGIAFLVASTGTERSIFTFGFGNSFYGSEFESEPLLLLSGYLRTSKYSALITENWINPGEAANFLSFGLRFFGKRFSADFAFVFPAGGSGGGFFPWVSVAYNFGN